MILLSILGILIAAVLLAHYWERKEMERHEQRMSLIRWYTDESDNDAGH